jgi:FkbM family methyltransferase
MLRFLKSIPVVRQIGRWWVNTFLEGSTVPIYGGHAKGMLWKRRKRYIHGYWLGDFETEFQQALASVLKPGMTFFDIGANAGFYSLVAWKKIGSTGKCVSVDPDPDNCLHMKELQSINHLAQWEIVEAAVADKAGTLTFETRTQGDPGGHLTQLEHFTGDNPKGHSQREVTVLTLDDLVNRFGKPDVMKVDIEGAEWEAFRDGAGKLLTVDRPLMFIEMHGNSRAKLLQELFEKHHYQLLTLDGKAPCFNINNIFHILVKPL